MCYHNSRHTLSCRPEYTKGIFLPGDLFILVCQASPDVNNQFSYNQMQVYESLVWILIASVHDICILFIFIINLQTFHHDILSTFSSVVFSSFFFSFHWCQSMSFLRSLSALLSLSENLTFFRIHYISTEKCENENFSKATHSGAGVVTFCF